MAIIPWRTRRQLLYLSIFALIILALIAGLIWYFWPQPTCFDEKQNQGEKNIDCGGPCAAPCIGEIRDLSVSWARFFKSREGFYDVAAFVDNPNLYAGLPVLKYRFTLEDANHVIITFKESETFINPGEKQIIFESNIPTGSRIPRYAYINFEAQQNWKYIKTEKSFLSVVRKYFTNFPFPQLSAEIRNDSVFDIKNVFVSAVLYDDQENVIGVSSTKIDLIPAASVQLAYFTWPLPFDKEPATIGIFVTTNLTINANK